MFILVILTCLCVSSSCSCLCWSCKVLRVRQLQMCTWSTKYLEAAFFLLQTVHGYRNFSRGKFDHAYRLHTDARTVRTMAEHTLARVHSSKQSCCLFEMYVCVDDTHLLSVAAAGRAGLRLSDACHTWPCSSGSRGAWEPGPPFVPRFFF